MRSLTSRVPGMSCEVRDLAALWLPLEAISTNFYTSDPDPETGKRDLFVYFSEQLLDEDFRL